MKTPKGKLSLTQLNLGFAAFGASLAVLAFKLDLLAPVTDRIGLLGSVIVLLILAAIALYYSWFSYSSIIVGFSSLTILMNFSTKFAELVTSDQNVYLVFAMLMLIAFLFRRSISRLSE